MTVIVVCCPDCGPVRLTRDQLELVISTVPKASRYSFQCPLCQAWISKPADPPIVCRLTGVVPCRHETPPAELSETHAGPPISLDDLIDLGLDLASTNEVARFAGR